MYEYYQYVVLRDCWISNEIMNKSILNQYWKPECTRRPFRSSIEGTPQQCVSTILDVGFKPRTFDLAFKRLSSRLVNWRLTVQISNFNQSTKFCDHLQLFKIDTCLYWTQIRSTNLFWYLRSIILFSLYKRSIIWICQLYTLDWTPEIYLNHNSTMISSLFMNNHISYDFFSCLTRHKFEFFIWWYIRKFIIK